MHYAYGHLTTISAYLMTSRALKWIYCKVNWELKWLYFNVTSRGLLISVVGMCNFLPKGKKTICQIALLMFSLKSKILCIANAYFATTLPPAPVGLLISDWSSVHTKPKRGMKKKKIWHELYGRDLEPLAPTDSLAYLKAVKPVRVPHNSPAHLWMIWGKEVCAWKSLAKDISV